MWLVGLGNPGSEYAGTRHNVGHDVARRLAARLKAKAVESAAKQRAPGYEAYRARVPGGAGREVTILVPLLYMNRSGDAMTAYEASAGERITPAETLVVCDDIYLPVGSIRVRAQGSTGGHNGLHSVERHFGTPLYPRLRIGVGHAGGEELVDHVLSRFDVAEREAVETALERAVEAAEVWAREGVLAAMNRFNQRARAEVRDE